MAVLNIEMAKAIEALAIRDDEGAKGLILKDEIKRYA